MQTELVELSPKRRRRTPLWLRWIALAMLLVVLAHAGWTFYWMQRFDRRIEELRAAGIPVELTEFATPPIPDAENANVSLMAADAWYEEHLLPGESVRYAVLFDKLERPEGVEDSEPEENLVALREWLATGDHYVELLSETAERKAMHENLQWGLGPEMDVHSLPAMVRLLNFLDLRVEHAARASASTLFELELMFRLARKAKSGLVLSLVVRWTAQTVAADAVRNYAALPEFDAASAWAALADHLRSDPDAELLRRSFRVERAMALWLTRRLLDGHDLVNGSVSSETAITWHYRALIYRDALRVLDQFDRAEKLLELSPRDAWKTAAAGLLEFELSPTTLLTGSYASMHRKRLKKRVWCIAKMRVARVGLALLVVRQRTGAWPDDLDAVVSMVGEHDVLNPYTGHRLAYVPGVSLDAVGAVTNEDMREDEEILWRFEGQDASK